MFLYLYCNDCGKKSMSSYHLSLSKLSDDFSSNGHEILLVQQHEDDNNSLRFWDNTSQQYTCEHSHAKKEIMDS